MKRLRKNVPWSWSWMRTGDGRCIPARWNISSRALLIVIANTILIWNCHLKALKVMVGSDECNWILGIRIIFPEPVISMCSSNPFTDIHVPINQPVTDVEDSDQCSNSVNFQIDSMWWYFWWWQTVQKLSRIELFAWLMFVIYRVCTVVTSRIVLD